jgi:hypothetical protein
LRRVEVGVRVEVEQPGVGVSAAYAEIRPEADGAVAPENERQTTVGVGGGDSLGDVQRYARHHSRVHRSRILVIRNPAKPRNVATILDIHPCVTK